MSSTDLESESTLPFLAQSTPSTENLPLYNTKSQSDINGNYQRNSYPTRFLTTLLLIFYIPLCIGFIWLYHQSKPQLPSCTTPNLLPSPARESGAITYKVHKLTVDIFNNSFSGPPRPESDEAWHDLIEHNNIYISRQEADQADINTVELSDGSGFVVIPAVGHQLHCLKRIRHWVYRDHYYSGASGEVLEEISAHVDHCIEMLRQEVMCHGDQSFSSFYYLNASHARDGSVGGSLTAQDFSLHQCVDWERLRGWMVARSVDVTEPGLLKSP